MNIPSSYAMAMDDEIAALDKEIDRLEKERKAAAEKFIQAWCPVSIGDIIEKNRQRILVREIAWDSGGEVLTWECKGRVLTRTNVPNLRYTDQKTLRFSDLGTGPNPCVMIERGRHA